MLGLQSWIALPRDSEEIAPSFQHYAAGDLPMIQESGFSARIIAGKSFGIASPVAMVSPWFYTEVTAQAGVSVPLDPDHEERAIYLIDGEIEIAGERHEGPRLLVFRPGDAITVRTLQPTRDTSGGISSPPARSGSSRRNKIGKPAALRPSRRSMSSFPCLTKLSPSPPPLRPSRLSRGGVPF
jgi:hypothetical protein